MIDWTTGLPDKCKHQVAGLALAREYQRQTNVGQRTKRKRLEAMYANLQAHKRTCEAPPV